MFKKNSPHYTSKDNKSSGLGGLFRKQNPVEAPLLQPTPPVSTEPSALAGGKLRFGKGFSSENEVSSPKSFFTAAESNLGSLTSPPLSETKNPATSSDISPELKTEKNPKTLNPYERFSETRTKLADLFNESAEIMQKLNMPRYATKLKSLCEKVGSEVFRVQITGTFKNGKSTFINSFLGEEVLPAYALPCTAVICEVKYGTTKRAVLHFKNPLPEKLPEQLSSEAEKHIKKHSGKKIPPIEIPYNKIEEMIVIPMGKNPSDMLLESPYEKVELFWPLEILKNGIEIIDSPGLNEHSTRTKVTMDYISNADAVVFVLNATAICSLEEMVFIENNLHTRGFEDLFFVINRFDMIPENEQKRLVQYAKKKLKPFTAFGDDGIFFLSARNALDAKISGNKAKLDSSGLSYFENKLSSFLTNQRGRMKILTPAKELRKFLSDEVLSKIIPRQEAIFNSEIDTLKEKYKDVRIKLDSYEAKKTLLQEKMTNHVHQNKLEIKHAALRNIREIASAIPFWIERFNPSTKPGLIFSKKKAESIAFEITSHVSGMFAASTQNWREKVLQPLMHESFTPVFESSRREIDTLLSDINHAGDTIAAIGVKSTLNYSPLFETRDSNRFFTENFSDKKNSWSLSFGSSAGLTNPLFSSASESPGSGGTSVIDKLKKTVCDQVVNNLILSAEEYSNAVMNDVADYYLSLAGNMLTPLNSEIDSIRSQIESTLDSAGKSESSIKTRKENLEAITEKIRQISRQTENFVIEVTHN